MARAGHAWDRLSSYLELVSAFVEGGIAAGEFRRRYLELYLGDEANWAEDEYAVLEALFGDSEVFEPDPRLCPQVIGAIDEHELREGATRALGALRRLATDTP
jgi:Bacterial self-protective colicin-like immunity